MTEVAAERILEWTVGDRLRRARETAGLEQGELATRLGISRGTVSNYELGHGKKPPKPYILKDWAAACDVPMSYIEWGEIPGGGPGGASTEVRHQGLEPRTRWFGRTGERRGFMPIAVPGERHPRRAQVIPLATDLPQAA